MPSTQDVTRAARGSKLPAPARHILLTLATLADPMSAEILAEDTPSLSDIAEYTGLGRSTVAEQLNRLEDLKWVERARPTVVDAWTKKAKTLYRLRVGTSPGAGLVQELDQSSTGTSPAPGLANGTEPDNLTSPGDGLVQELDTLLSSNSQEQKNSSSSRKSGKAKKAPKPPPPPRPDVERICQHLADRRVSNGCLRPTINQEWRDAARLLIDKDRRSVENIIKAIDWSQDDSFWKSNIKSMPKLREQYDTLRLRAQAEAKSKRLAEERGSARASPPSNAPTRVTRDEACPKHPYETASACGACASERLAAKGARP